MAKQSGARVLAEMLSGYAGIDSGFTETHLWYTETIPGDIGMRSGITGIRSRVTGMRSGYAEIRRKDTELCSGITEIYSRYTRMSSGITGIRSGNNEMPFGYPLLFSSFRIIKLMNNLIVTLRRVRRISYRIIDESCPARVIIYF
jgi:hypothetical protein